MIYLYPILLTGSLAGALLNALLYPIDVAKTRRQMQSELITAKYRWYQIDYHRRSWQQFVFVVRHIGFSEGFRTMRIGLGPMFFTGAITTVMKIASYNYAYSTSFLSTTAQDVLEPRSIAFCGCIGGMTQLCMTPIILIKMRLQYWSLCQTATLKDIARENNFWEIGLHLYRKFGWKVFTIGWAASVYRGMFGSVVQMVSYEFTMGKLVSKKEKEKRLQWGCKVAFFASFLSTVLVAPFDVVLTRVHNQPYSLKLRGLYYENCRDCMLKIFLNEGYQGFYKGFILLYMKHGTMGALSLLFFDQWKDDSFQEMPETTTSFAKEFLDQEYVQYSFEMSDLF